MRADRRVHHGLQRMRRRRSTSARRITSSSLSPTSASGKRSNAPSAESGSAGRRTRESGRDVVSRLEHDGNLPNQAADAQGYLQRIAFKDGDRSVVIKAAEIVWIEAEDYYVLFTRSRAGIWCGRRSRPSNVASIPSVLSGSTGQPSSMWKKSASSGIRASFV